MLELVAVNTQDEIDRAKDLRQMFINLKCPRCKRVAKCASDLQDITDNCTRCGKVKH